MNIKLTFSLLAVALIIATIIYYFAPQLPVATGYVARMTCTCTFAAGREKKEITEHNFFYSVLGMVNTTIDRASKEVVGSIFGFAKQIAVFKPGIGCVLLDGEDNNHIEFPKHDSIVSTSRLWPMDSAFSMHGVNLISINAAVDKAFDKGDILEKRTTSLLIVYKDSLIVERYQAPFHKDMPQLGWSMTKSWMNAFTGLMVMDSTISVDEKSLFKQWTDDRKNISIKNLLTMTSGLEWEENYSTVSDATVMLYDAEDVAEKAISKPLDFPINEKWYYSSATTNILSKMAQGKLGSNGKYLSYLHNRLFRPLGMSSAFVETDELGTMIMSSYGYATARDWARFGLLYLHDGMIGQQRILPKGWVDFTRTAANNSNGDYGAHFWLNQGGEYPDAPRDMYYADGYLGQFIYIIPSHDLVIVRLGGDGKYFDGNALIKEVIASLPKK